MRQKALLAEFIGTFTLIFIGVGAIAADNITGGKVGLTGIALAHGLAIGVMASATAAVSGGHLNPAVTISLWSARKIDSVNPFLTELLSYPREELIGKELYEIGIFRDLQASKRFFFLSVTIKLLIITVKRSFVRSYFHKCQIWKHSFLLY